MNHIAPPYRYDWGYIALRDIQIDGLPESIDVGGVTLSRKTELHMSLINAEGIAQLIDPVRVAIIEAELVERFASYVTRHDLTQYRLFKRFRFVERGDRKSLIVMAEVPQLAGYFSELSQAYAIALPIQPAHTTLYTLQPDKGIGILSDEELERDSHEVTVGAFENVQFKPIRKD